MRLRRSVVRGPGLRRVRRGRGFSYHNPDSTAVTDAVALQRINDLVDFLTLVDALAQKFFQTNSSLRAALDLLAQKPER